MQGKLFALGLLACAQGALAADTGEFSLGVGFNYSSGEYGTSTTTESLSVPIIARYDRGPWIFKLTVPYLSISGGTSVVPGVGRVTSSNPRRRGGGAREATGTGPRAIAAGGGPGRRPPQASGTSSRRRRTPPFMTAPRRSALMSRAG